MLVLLLCALLTTAAAALWRLRIGAPADPWKGDWQEYQRWRVAPRPFAWRWLVPVLTRGQAGAWSGLVLVCLIGSGPALGAYLLSRGATDTQAIAGVAIWTLLPGVWERHGQVLYLVDAPALVFALVAATTALDWPIRVAAALLAGATRETAPVLAASFAWDAWPLVGLLAVPWWRTGAPWRSYELYVQPWRTFARQRWQAGWSLEAHVLPFGGALPGFAFADPRVWAALAIAALPVLRSVDTARLLTQAAPAVIAAAVLGASSSALLGMVALGVVLSSNWQA